MDYEFPPETKHYVPIWEKQNLKIEEAAAYSNIGIKRLEYLVSQPDCPFVLHIGNRKLIKRKLFDEYIEKIDTI